MLVGWTLGPTRPGDPLDRDQAHAIATRVSAAAAAPWPEAPPAPYPRSGEARPIKINTPPHILVIFAVEICREVFCPIIFSGVIFPGGFLLLGWEDGGRMGMEVCDG